MKAKVILLMSGLLTLGSAAFGQVRFVGQDPYNNYSVGLNVGYTTMYGDLSQSNPQPAFILSLAKHMSSTILIGVELQHGTLSSTEPANKWTTGLNMTNQFNGFNVNGKVSLAEVIKNPQNIVMKGLSNLYAGVGAGIIANDITSITNKFKTTDATTIDPDFKKNSIALVVPFNVGLNIYMKKFLGYKGAQFNINYQLAYTFSDYIDGYKFPAATTRNQYNDAYSILSVGLAFYIGHVDEYQ
jgi:hypothetical protein